jgi:hypothetical protein
MDGTADYNGHAGRTLLRRKIILRQFDHEALMKSLRFFAVALQNIVVFVIFPKIKVVTAADHLLKEHKLDAVAFHRVFLLFESGFIL